MTSASDDRPDIVVFGVGHSGTTLVASMLFALGWNRGATAHAADEEYCEHIEIRECNRHALAHGALPANAASVLAGLKTPWAIKDPRFVITLPLWQPLLGSRADRSIVLLWITKDLEQVKRSHELRGELHNGVAGSHGHTVDDLWQCAKTYYEQWPGPKVSLSYESLADAAQRFLPQRTPGGPDLLRQQITRATHLQEAVDSLKLVLQQRDSQIAELNAKLALYRRDNGALKEKLSAQDNRYAT